MNKGRVAATLAVVASLGLGGPLAAYAQTAAAPEDDDLTALLESDDAGTAAEPAQAAAPAEAGAADGAGAEAAPSETASSEPAPSEPAPAAAAASPTLAPAPAESYDTIPLAQQAEAAPMVPPPSAERGMMIEEIVVTARRTAENLQDVPVAISALSGADLARESINSAQDLQGRVPSLVISPGAQTRNTETPTIRGQGATFGASPGVVIYFAEVPQPGDSTTNGQGGPGKFFDLSNMQVLKGSQGTLFGRNTTGGALLLEPRKPQDEFSAYLKAEGTSFSGRGYEGVINLPLASDTLLMRAGIKYFDREGFTTDVVTGKDYDSKHFYHGRLGLTWRPTEGVENYLFGYYSNSKDNGTANVIEAVNSEGFNAAILTAAGAGPLPLVPAQQQPGCVYFNVNAPSNDCGQDIAAEQQARSNRRVQLSADPNDILKTGGVIDAFSFALSDDVTLRNIASYSFYEHHFRWDLDGSRARLNDIDGPDDRNSSDTAVYTEELQLQGTLFDDRLKFVVGGYYEYMKPTGLQENYVTALFNTVYQVYEITRHSYGPFAQATYGMGGLAEALEDLSLTVGTRYSVDQIEGSAAINDEPVSGETDDSALTWTVGLDYKLENSMLYGKVSRGYKTGGFSPIAVDPAHLRYAPEFVLNYEVGYKTDFDIGTVPARVNAALYYTDYTDMQRTGGDSYVAPDAPPGTMQSFGGAVFNAGKAWISGFEIDATVVPFTGFNLSANYAYTEAEYEEFELLIGGVTPPLDCSGQRIPRGEVADFKCMPFQYTPKHQYSVSARYELPVAESVGTIEGSLTYSWVGERYSSAHSLPEDEPGAWMSALGLVNASIRWDRIMNSRMNLQLYGTNLTGEDYRLANSNVWNFLYLRSSIYGEPRVFGLTLSYDWGGS